MSDRSPSPIRLRDSPDKVREKLGLGPREFDHFKTFARRAHNEYCASYPRSRWSDVDVVWTAIPADEKRDVTGLMRRLCTDSSLFPSTTGAGVIDAGIEQRLHQVRRTWQQTERGKPQ